MIDLRRIIGYKSGYMLETLVNDSLLVYNLCTSENGCPVPINWDARQSAGKASKSNVKNKRRIFYRFC